ncbi:unnamed protein product, partial [Closterium sp. NIES-53]
QKITNARDGIFYERLNLAQFRKDEQTNANRVYTNDRHSYATPKDEAAAAILEQDTRGEFTRGDHHNSDDNDEYPPEGGVGAAGGSSRGAATPPPPKPESDDDDVQEVIPQHRHDSTVEGLQLLGLHTATSTAPHVIEPKNPRQALTGPHSKEWREAMDQEIQALVDRAAINGSSGNARRHHLQHDVKQFLSLNISYSPEAIHLLAAKYTEELSKCFNITPAPLSTPYRTPGPNHKSDNKALSPAGLQTYHQQLGCLLFACFTCRPDLSYIVSQLAQYSRKPTAENLLDLQCALQFFVSTPNIGLCYSTVTTSSFNLNGYVDADHAADPDNRRSRIGFLFRLEPTGPISWNLQKQELVALSSAEAEFIVAKAAVREGLYLQELLHEAKIPTSPTFRLYCNNQSAIRIANKPGFVNRTKHIALRDGPTAGRVTWQLTSC